MPPSLPAGQLITHVSAIGFATALSARALDPLIPSIASDLAVDAAHGAPRINNAADPRLKAFRAAFDAVLADLAEQVARDGEGARKLVEIKVEGATSKNSARRK